MTRAEAAVAELTAQVFYLPAQHKHVIHLFSVCCISYACVFFPLFFSYIFHVSLGISCVFASCLMFVRLMFD